MAAIIAVVGWHNTGKTKTAEVLIKELTKKGYKVGAIKHIPKPNFSIDTEGKDTWRFAHAGAKTVVSVASDEIATIEKVNVILSLEEILKRCEGSEIVILEGFKNLVREKENVPKIVVVKSEEEADEALKIYKPILAFTGPYILKRVRGNIPYFDVLKEKKKIANFVEKKIKKDIIKNVSF